MYTKYIVQLKFYYFSCTVVPLYSVQMCAPDAQEYLSVEPNDGQEGQQYSAQQPGPVGVVPDKVGSVKRSTG